MTEYTDLKNRTYKVIETVRDYSMETDPEEQRETAEREIVEALFRIFRMEPGEG
ncbi:MAG: hypothetical protein IKY52_04425 [Clostridia bacterium]|nr:hypothetical protein [Clostridia bacterium]